MLKHQAMKTHRRAVENIQAPTELYPEKETLVDIGQEAGWAPNRYKRGTKERNLSLP